MRIKNFTNKEIKREIRRSVSGCPICGPHSGCNSSSGNYGMRSWKNYRKTKYKYEK